MDKLCIRRRGYALGAEITGVDASKPLDDATIAELRKACLEHIVVSLPGQDLSREEYREFCRQFGELETEHIRMISMPDMPEIAEKANKPLSPDGKRTRNNQAANHWHADYIFTVNPVTIVFLLGKDRPEVGGDTQFVNMYMAYEGLSPAFQRMLESLSGVHDFYLGAVQVDPGNQVYPPVVYPVVRIHPETNRKMLCVTNRIRYFSGMTEEESKPIVDFLLEHVTKYEYMYRHRWADNDLVMWDNRCTLHYAVQDFDQEQLRRNWRCSVAGPKTGKVYIQPDSGSAIPSASEKVPAGSRRTTAAGA